MRKGNAPGRASEQRGQYGPKPGAARRQIPLGRCRDHDAVTTRTLRKCPGDDCTDNKIYPVSSGSVVFKITATREQIDTVSEAFNYFPEICGELAEKTIDFDKGILSTSQYKTFAANIADKLEDLADSVNRIIAGTSDNSILKGYSQLLDQAREKLENISIKNTDSALAFSSEIKYNYIELAHMYIQYIHSLDA